MKDDSQMLAETVVIGYGSAKKRDLTGSITNIKGDEIANKPVVNPVSALQGKIAGVQVINSGKAGSDPEIRVPVCFLARIIVLEVRAVGTSMSAQERWYMPIPVKTAAHRIKSPIIDITPCIRLVYSAA